MNSIKKIKENKNLKKGVSLIVLIITIIVIIILAVAVILSIANNNPIENAKEAKEKNDAKVLEETANLIYQDWYTKKELNQLTEEDKNNPTAYIQNRLKSEYGYSQEIASRVSVDESGNLVISNGEEEIDTAVYDVWDGSVDTQWYDENETEFEISKASELAGLAKIVNDKSDSFEGKTINLNNVEWTPIGSQEFGFSGKFEGNNHSIKKMKITEAEGYVALFASVKQYNDNEVCIKDLIVKDSYIVGERAGCIVGDLSSDSHNNDLCYIQNCGSMNNHIEGNISSGGIANWLLSAKIQNSYNTSEVVCNFNSEVSFGYQEGLSGGIEAGSPDSNSIINCYNTGTISAPGCYAGGIAGGTEMYTIKNCYNIGSVTGKENYTGSICGYDSWSTINNCYYLTENVAIGTDDYDTEDEYYEVDRKDILSKTEEQMKSADTVSGLGSAFVLDVKNINNGYPILAWQNN